jgi:DNA-binding PucR family transcriptional regulator
MAQAFLAHIAAHAEDAVRAAEMQRVSHVLFEQIDGFAEAVAQEFQREHDDSVVASTAARIEAVNGVLDGGSLSTQGNRALGYPLGGLHRALVVWVEGETSGGAADALRTAAATLLDRLRSTHRLLLPVGAGAMWAWGTVPPETEPAESLERLAIPAGVRAALGQAGTGAAGFRDSHREARAVERLIGLNGNSLPPIVDHASVALVCLLSGDLPAARAFVRSQLGPLGGGGRRSQDLRRTLRCYLDQERSLARVSALLHISRNTVTYRIRQAEQLACRSIDRDHQDLHAALLLCDVLGPRTAD